MHAEHSNRGFRCSVCRRTFRSHGALERHFSSAHALPRQCRNCGKPLEQAWPLVFLASQAASYVNGVNLIVDGGHSAARTLGLLA